MSDVPPNNFTNEPTMVVLTEEKYRRLLNAEYERGKREGAKSNEKEN
jgi:L-2-hydroxyglutarate oxidase LhgO